MSHQWEKQAIQKIEADFNRSADTHLIKVDLPAVPGIYLYMKDESIHPTGSLKHRLARSLFLYGLCSGWIHQDTTIIEMSSGSTAVSEAYFARLLDLPFIAVMPDSTSEEKIRQIKFYGGDCHLVPKGQSIHEEVQHLVRKTGGHFMDQFTYAERATDWRGNNNIADSIFQQMAKEPYPVPTWIVVGAGTGGTSATIGRYTRYYHSQTKLCVVDPENSVFSDFYQKRDRSIRIPQLSQIEGIGRPEVPPSFIPDVIDRLIDVPDAASMAAIRFLEKLLDRRCGGSTGTNLYGTFLLMAEMIRNGEIGSVVTLICDPGERYAQTYYNDDWIASHNYDLSCYLEQLECFAQTGKWHCISDTFEG